MHKVERKHFPVLLTTEERNKLHALAAAANVLASDWIRDTIARTYKKQFGDKPVSDERVKTDPVTIAAGEENARAARRARRARQQQ